MPLRISGSVAAILIALSALAGTASAAFASPHRAHKALSASPIQHVIVMLQENRTIDNLFNGYPGANTVRAGLNALGQQQNLVPQCMIGCGFDPDHTHLGFVRDYNNAAMNGFDLRCPTNPCQTTNFVYSQSSDTSIYFGLASNNVLADSVFQMNQGPSFAAHIFLIAAQGGYPYSVSDNQVLGTLGQPGCLGNATVQAVDLRTYLPGTLSTIPACVEVPTIMDLLDTAGVSWKFYNPGTPGQPLVGLWTSPYFVKHMYNNPVTRAKVVSPETTIVSDIQGGTLPQVSYVVPTMANSDHPHVLTAGEDPLGGPHWVASVVNAVGQSQYWSNTVVLITWDDWGGFYDHVVPPSVSSNSYGFRVPLIVVSAYPKVPGLVDHTSRNQGSVITFIESLFGLGYIGGAGAGKLDSRTDDLSGTFDFTQAPRPYQLIKMSPKVRWHTLHQPALGPDDD